MSINQINKYLSSFLLLVLFSLSAFSQVTIWEEDFSTYTNGTTVGTGNKWTITTTSNINTGGNNYFQVRNNYFEARDTNAQEQIFSTEVIDISTYTNVSLNVDAFKTGGGMESGDYVKIYYKLDGGVETLFTTDGDNLAEFGTVTPQETGLSGSTVQIIIKVQNGTGNAERYGFDNILIEGTFCIAEFTGGTTSQSSTYSGGGAASRARDGNTSGVWSNSSVTHTALESNPWWELDMGVDKTIDNIEIYNRTDCCGTRLDNFILEVLDASDNVLYTHNNGSAATLNAINGINTLGRKVRISLPGNQYLSLAEVVVNVNNCLDVTYCDSNGNDTSDEYIGNVVLNTINNPSGAGTTSQGYSDFTSISTDLEINSTHTITITPTWPTPWIYDEGYSVWIDYNQNGDFTDSGEQVWTQAVTNTTPVSGSFTIPATATLGSTRMRVSMKWNDIPTSCESFNWGEVEDYTINIISNCSTNTWTGAIDSDWNTTANWSCGSVPTSTTNVLIPTGVANFPEIYSADAAGLSNNIEIESGATLKIYDNYIEIAGTLLLNGFIDLVDEGQLIQTTGSIFDSTSTGYIERDQQGEGNRYRYNDWSSPVIKTGTALGTPFTVADVLRDGTDPNNPKAINFVSGYNGAVGSPIAIAEYWIYKYANSPTGDYNSWQQIKSTGNLKPGEGFLMKGTGNPGSSDQNYVFQGKPNNGTIQLSVAANNDYLIGNPYPSAIDAVQFLIDNPGVNGGALYFWEHYGGDSHNLADYQAGYATINLLGVSTPASSNLPSGVSSAGSSVKTLQRYIPVGQGFFFWAGGSNTTIEFNNGQRIFKTEASGESVFMKGTNTKTSKTATTVDTRPIIRIGFDAPEIDHRQLIIGADEKATDNVDWGYDAIIYETLDDDMYWIIENDKYVIQGINTIDSETELPIGVKSNQGGLISIKVDELINTPEDIEIYVLDKTTNTTFDIKNGTFETILEPNTTFTNKYSIVFKQYEVLAINEEILDQNLLVYVNNSEKLIVIKNNTNFEIEGITLYNYLGQNIKQWNSKFDEEMLTLPVENNQGVYIIKILTSKGILSKKIIIE